jgi:minor histocompatibility antigen H13
MASPGPAYEVMGRIAYEFAQMQPFIPTYLHLLVSAVFPIYAGAHASLSRPSSAAKGVSTSRGEEEDSDDHEDDDDQDSKMEGLSPADAIMFPLVAGLTLGGLYLLIKWLEDPAILNRVLAWYFSAFGIMSVGKLLGDALTLITSFIFPQRWGNKHGTWHVRAEEQKFSLAKGKATATSPTDCPSESPLPGSLSRLPLSSRITERLWALRLLVTELWSLRIKVHGATLLRTKFGFYDVVGLVFGLSAVIVYNFIDKPWWLTNLMGFGFAYGAIQMMSPTTFWTGTLIFSSLFLYDIYFVFYT